MSAAAYERDQARLKLYELLNAAEEDVRHGDRGINVKRLAALLVRIGDDAARSAFFVAHRWTCLKFRTISRGITPRPQKA